MIKYLQGNILDTSCDAIINPCNCVGVAGAGLSKQLANKYPSFVKKYKQGCSDQILALGYTTFTRIAKPPDRPFYIINFPTKHHWRDLSNTIYIKAGLDDLITRLEEQYEYTPDYLQINSVAVCRLGCGLGGLDWGKDVKPLVESAANLLPEILWEIYE